MSFIAGLIVGLLAGGTYNGGSHGRGVGINRDYEKNNLAQIGGWRVLSFDTKQVKSGDAVAFTQSIIQQGAK